MRVNSLVYYCSENHVEGVKFIRKLLERIQCKALYWDSPLKSRIFYKMVIEFFFDRIIVL